MTKNKPAIIRKGEIFIGPLPPPQKLREYDQVVPGAAKRILSMAEKQAVHRQALETNVITTESFKSKIGIILGFILILTTIVAGSWLILNDKQISGLSTIIVAIGAPSVALIKIREERSTK